MKYIISFYFRMEGHAGKAAPTLTVSRAGALREFIIQYSFVMGGITLLSKLANDFIPW